MAKHRTPYPAEFRAQMVELVKAGRGAGGRAQVPGVSAGVTSSRIT
jgi:hypothetical protein